MVVIAAAAATAATTTTTTAAAVEGGCNNNNNNDDGSLSFKALIATLRRLARQYKARMPMSVIRRLQAYCTNQANFDIYIEQDGVVRVVRRC